MSRRLLAFLVSELRTLRVICKNPACGAVVELAIDAVPAKLFTPECRFCGQEFVPAGTQDNPYVGLAKSIARLQQYADRADVEFILPDADE